jgi:hypothetical protein
MPISRVFGDPQVDALRARQAVNASIPGPVGPPGPPGLSGAVIGLPSIAALRAAPVAGVVVDTTAILLGYYAEGDGGGGEFFWTLDVVSLDDGGTIIVPTVGPRTGAWKRVMFQPINPKWWGAKGDANTILSPDLVHTIDQVAIQKAIDWVAPGLPINGAIGNDVLLPPGQYAVNAPANDAAIWIDKQNTKFWGAGGAPYGAQILVIGVGTGIVIESGPSVFPGRGVELRNLSIYGQSISPLDGIVVHAPNISLYDCWVVQFSRHGCLIESGTVGSLIGVTRAPPGTTFNADFWRITDMFFQQCGNTLTGNGDPNQGAGVYAHGADSNGGCAITCAADACNVGYHDGTLGSATWLACYSEAGNLSFSNASLNSSLYLGCFSEDTIATAFAGTSACTIEGSITQLNGAVQRVGPNRSELTFGAYGADRSVYGDNVPGQHNSVIDFTRDYAARDSRGIYTLGALINPPIPNGFYYIATTAGTSAPIAPSFAAATFPGSTVTDGTVVWTWAGVTLGVSTWAFAYQPVLVGALPYQLQSYRWTHYSGGSLTPDINPYGSPFGWTEIGNPRGDGLPFIAAPLINSERRWSFRQEFGSDGAPIVLQPGPNVLFANGNVGLDNGALQLAATSTAYWPQAQSRVSIGFEFPNLAAFAGADIHMVGYTFIPKGGSQRNIAASIINSGGAAITVIPVWHYENFVQNYNNSQP